MAQNILKAKGRRVAPKKAKTVERKIVLVGTYREGQLAWIKKNRLYNYPVREGDKFGAALGKVSELWLYAGTKAKRHCFEAKFVRQMTREEWLKTNPSYAKLGKPKKPGKKISVLPKSENEAYYVFEVRPLDYGTQFDAPEVITRVADFGGRSAKIKKAIEQYEKDGKFASLAAYLPTELSQVPQSQLRVCEPWVQMEFFNQMGCVAMPMAELSIEEVAKKERTSIKVIRRLVASGQLPSVRHGARYYILKSSLAVFNAKQPNGVVGAMNATEVHFVPGKGIDPEQREMRRRGKRIGAAVSRRVCRQNANLERKADDVNWQDISDVWDCPGHSRGMTFVDLFCGAGGLSKGLEMAGLEGICGLDWFDEAGLTYTRNFNHPFVNGDIKLPENKERFYETVAERLHGRPLSLVAGGFPCQGFSMSGNRIVDDPRNSLYEELVEIVEHLQPEFVLCENVKGLRSMLHGAVEDKILSDFRRIGYDMNVTTLCAADYYTPQKRERVIFIGNRLGVRNLHPKPLLKPAEYRTTGEAIADLMDYPSDPAFNHEPTHHSAAMIERMRTLPEGQSLYAGYRDAWKRCPWNEASCTIKENHGGVNVHPLLPRVLTAREMARIQSFPDDFIFEGKKAKQLVQIGNAVPPFLGKAIGLALRFAKRDI